MGTAAKAHLGIGLSVLLLLPACTPEAGIEENSTGTYLVWNGRQMVLPITGKNLQLRSCRLWKEFPNLLISEISYEEDGQFTDLFVFQLDTPQPQKLFQFAIAEDYIFRDSQTGETERVRKHYSPLFENQDGLPFVRLKQTQEAFPLHPKQPEPFPPN
ncbi:MAG TPA: hypothetical protein PLC99_14935 [Verrucomicrobiota bacterium]|nr:hypothetical protein [Verrucomicrobiota bacterium]